MVYQKDKSCETFLIGLVERRKQVVDNRNIDGVWSANSIFFGMFSKMICTSPLTKTGYLCMLMTTKYLHWPRKLMRQKSF